MPTELILTNGERFTVRANMHEVDQELARRGHDGFFAEVHPIDQERVVYVNPIHVVRLASRD